jgi:hypothetical protein
VRRNQKFANPFYALLLAAGIAFALTATAYVVMAYREARPAGAEIDANATARDHPLMVFMNRHGAAALMTELALLALGTFAAIGTDDYWQRRANRHK